jgi:hypothetical protein
MIEQGQNIVGQLRHGQYWRIGDAREAAYGQIGTQFRLPVSAQVWNDGPDASQAFDQGTPILLIERRRMQKHNRQPSSGFPKAEAGIG